MFRARINPDFYATLCLDFGTNLKAFKDWARANTGKEVTIELVKQTRTTTQLAFVHKLFDYIAGHTGFSKEETKTIEKRRHLTPKEVEVYGQKYLVLPSLATLPKPEMSEFIERVLADCAELGIVVPTREQLGYLPN